MKCSTYMHYWQVPCLLTAYITSLLENRAKETNYPCHNEVFLNDYLYLKVFCAKINTNKMCQNSFRHKYASKNTSL